MIKISFSLIDLAVMRYEFFMTGPSKLCLAKAKIKHATI